MGNATKPLSKPPLFCRYGWHSLEVERQSDEGAYTRIYYRCTRKGCDHEEQDTEESGI